MALVLENGKEVRRPGNAIPREKRRWPIFDFGLDSMSLSEFRKLPPLEREKTINAAREQRKLEARSEQLKTQLAKELKENPLSWKKNSSFYVEHWIAPNDITIDLSLSIYPWQSNKGKLIEELSRTLHIRISSKYYVGVMAQNKVERYSNVPENDIKMKSIFYHQAYLKEYRWNGKILTMDVAYYAPESMEWRVGSVSSDQSPFKE